MNVTGRWRIVEMDLWDLAAIELQGPAFIEFRSDQTGQFWFIAAAYAAFLFGGITANSVSVAHLTQHGVAPLIAGSITARVSMEFQLIDRKTRKQVWSHFYTHAALVQGKTIPDVVAALDQNLEQGLSEMESGLDAYFSARLPNKS